MPTDRPVAPPLDDLDGPEYLFTLSTGAYGLSQSEVFGMLLGAAGIETALDLDGLERTDFWRRGGPVLAYHKHDLIIGRTGSLWRDHDGLHARMRFGQTPLAADIRRSLDQQAVWTASIGVHYHPSMDYRHPGVIKVAKLMLPVLLGLSLPQLHLIIACWFASHLRHGDALAGFACPLVSLITGRLG